MATTSTLHTRLQPYLPRLTLEWLAESPDARHRLVDGSLVFADISGFTKLSEKLAKLGPVGAEEMAGAITRCFTDLLGVAYDEDGALLKFGGDALLVLFSGEDPEKHAAQAARAAVGMRKRLQAVGKLVTLGGRVNLRMSVGAHSGRFDFFLVGESHRELIVTGPGSTRVVEMEGIADAGEIVVSPEFASNLPAACVSGEKSDGRVLRRAPTGAVSPVWMLPELPDDVLEGSIPVAIRDTLVAAIGEPEHRQVSVAFVHFEGTDELLRTRGPDVVADALHRLVGETQAAVDEYGVCFLGSDVDADGGKLILTAGAPRALGDDEERMLLALRRIADADLPIPVRIGVNKGPVFAGDIGPRFRRTYTVMGDAVNLAARVMSKAPPGEIYATESVLDRSATRFRTVEIEPFMVKGKARPVQAWSVGVALTGRRGHGDRATLPLVARDAEMEVLRVALGAAHDGRRRLVDVVGEAGIGKSRLLQELRAEAQDFVVTGATADAYTATTPYVAWRAILRGLAGIGWEDPSDVVVGRLRELVLEHDPSLLPWLPLIAAAADAEMPPTPEVGDLGHEFLRPKLHEAVEAFLCATVRTPTIFALEDAHLIDEVSAELLTAVATIEGEERPWLFLILRRPAEGSYRPPEHEAVSRLEVGPLDPVDAMLLAERATEAQPLTPDVLERVVERSNGSPQLLLDLVNAAIAGSGSLPESVEAAAMVLIDRLPPSDRSLLRHVSVFGLSFHPRFVPDVLDEGTTAPDGSTWRRLEEFLEDDGNGFMKFRRAVVRDAAYRGLPFRVRRRLHGIVGSRLESDTPDPDELAGLLSLHYFLAEEYPKAWPYATKAGERASGVFANAEAARLFSRAIEAGRRSHVEPEELRSVYERLGMVQLRAGLFTESRKSFAEAHHLAQDPVTRARMMMRRSYVEEYVGSYPRALGWLTRAHHVLEGVQGDDARRLGVELVYRQAAVYYNVGRAAEALRRSRRAIEMAEEAGVRDVLGHSCNILGNSLAWLGKPGAEEQFRRALAIYEEQGLLPGQAMVQLNLGASAYWEGRWDDALELYNRALELHTRTGNPVEAAFAGENIAEIYIEQGYLDEAEVLLRDASRKMRATGELTGLAGSLGFLGRVSVRSGRLDEAAERLSQARAVYARLGTKAGVYEIDAREAERLVMDGRSQAALELADATFARMNEDVGIEVLAASLMRTRGYALVQLGRLADARAAFGESLAAAKERGAAYEAALTIQGLARLDRLEHRGDPSNLEAAAQVTFERLGVIAIPAFTMHRAPS